MYDFLIYRLEDLQVKMQSGLYGRIDYFFGFEKFFFIIIFQIPYGGSLLEWQSLVCQFATFQADKPVGQGISPLGSNVFADDLYQIGKGHDGTAHDEIKLLFLFFGTFVAESRVL